MSIQEIELLSHKVTLPPLPNRDNWQPKLPATDESVLLQGAIVEEGVGFCAAISYVDAKGVESERRITIKDVYKDAGDYRIDAWCHERNAWRQFLGSRIINYSDAVTGEVWDTADAVMQRLILLADHAENDQGIYTTRLLRQTRPSINILLFLARCDGHLHPAEIDAVLRHVDRCSDGRRYDEQRVDRLVRKQRPEQTVFLTSLKKIIRTEPKWLGHIVRDAKQVIEADEIIASEEAKYGAELHSHIQALVET